MNSNNNSVNCGNISVHVHLAKALHILTRSSPTLAGVNCSVLYSIKALQYNNTTASAVEAPSWLLAGHESTQQLHVGIMEK